MPDRDATAADTDERRSRDEPDRWWTWIVGGIVLALLVIAVADIPIFIDDWTRQ